MKTLIIFSSLISLSFASYCGQSAIPFSFEAMANGQPILGCARPSCFGWNADGKRSADAAQFYKIGKQSDGFLRKTDLHGPVIKNATYFQPQFSICDRYYMSDQCAQNQWVGGISPLPKISSDSTYKVMCCAYTKLMESTDQGIAEIKPGQTVVGGEIEGEDGRQHSFEYISNIRRSFNENGEVVYNVEMKRFPCLPEPLAVETGVEDGTVEDLIKNVEKVQKPEAQFAAPTYQVQQQPLQQAAAAAAPTFNAMRFDIPSHVPADQQQQQQPLQLATAEPSTQLPPSSGCRKLSNGKFAPCAKSYPDEEAAIPQQQPIAIPQTQQAAVGATYQPSYNTPQPQYYQQQQQQQTSMFDPLGLFQHNYAAAAQPATYAPPAANPMFQQQHQYQQQQHQQAAASIPQPNHSYNPYWPFQGYYDYSQNPSAAYGVQTAQVGQQQLQPLSAAAAHGVKTAIPRPQPLPIPTVEDVEKAIPAAGRRMIYNVARTLLNL